MATITKFEDLNAWQTARELTNLIYKLSSDGTFAKDFGLKDQIRRASVSVMSNIALDQNYITKEQFKIAYNLAEKVSRQLFEFISYLGSNPRARRIKEDSTHYTV